MKWMDIASPHPQSTQNGGGLPESWDFLQGF